VCFDESKAFYGYPACVPRTVQPTNVRYTINHVAAHQSADAGSLLMLRSGDMSVQYIGSTYAIVFQSVVRVRMLLVTVDLHHIIICLWSQERWWERRPILRLLMLLLLAVNIGRPRQTACNLGQLTWSTQSAGNTIDTCGRCTVQSRRALYVASTGHGWMTIAVQWSSDVRRFSFRRTVCLYN